MPEDEPYKPRYKGFDEEATERAQATGDASQRRQAGRGEMADADYMESGPDEAAEREGRTREEVEESVERSARRGRRE